MEDFIVKYSSHLEFSRHTTIPDVHESARDVLKAWYESVQIWLAQKCVSSNFVRFKFGWLKNGSAQIWLAQKWGCSNMCLLKFGPAQIWVGSNLAA